MSMDNAAVVVVLVTYNQRSHTLEALRSLQNASYPACRVVLVDNASVDGTAEEVGAAFPDTEIVRVGRNTGCSGGRNLGLRRALELGPEYIFLLDNDCFVERGTIPAFVEAAASDREAGVFTGKMFWWTRPTVLWGAGGVIDWRHGRTPVRGTNELDHGQYDSLHTIDYASGGYTFVRTSVARAVGDIDEDYFIYYEDPDWCMRARRLGFSCRFVPGARVWHNANQSGGGSPAFHYYRARNRPLFMSRNAGSRYRGMFWPSYWRDTLNTYYMLRRSRLDPQARGLVRGVQAYFRKEWGPYPQS